MRRCCSCCLPRFVAYHLIDTLGCFGVGPAVHLHDEANAFASTTLVAVVVAVAMPVIEPEAIFATAGGTGLVLTVECVRMPGHRPWATSRVFVRGFLAQSKDSESSKISLWFVSLKGLQGSQGLRDIGEETPVPSMFPGR